jgi:plasmid stabilization system protein ParE
VAQPNLEFHTEALLELEEAARWYAERSQVAAVNFRITIEKALSEIVASPQRWPLVRDEQRRFLLHHFPFGIVYHHIPGIVRVVAIAHLRRRPEYWSHREF